MKIKTKLTLGVGLLFLMIALLTVLGAFYVNKLSVESKNILADNYNSIDYCRLMLNSLNNDIHSMEAQQSFSKNLALQQQTITEIGEKELTDKLAQDFNQIIHNETDSLSTQNIRKDIMDIQLLNMQALQRKSIIAQQTAENAILWISIIGTICFILAFTLLVNLPSNISNPIKELTKSVKGIAEKNYSQRVHFEGHNEFGELAKSFNTMAKKLEEYSNSNLERLMMAKKRIETLINNMKEPVIGLDENRKILFMNDIALKIAGLNHEQVIGVNIHKIAEHNDLIHLLTKDLSELTTKPEHSKQLPIKIFADNKESYFEKEIIPIQIVPTGEIEEKNIGKVILLKNITTYKELDFAKTNFIATVSHELKTPIASIKMSLDLLENKKIGEVNPEQQHLIQSVRDDSERLLKITGELLDMTQAESGKIQLNVQKTSLNQIIQYAFEAVRVQALQKQIKIEYLLPQNDLSINADQDKTAWVLINLLTNAIHYSHENSKILLTINELNEKISISVQDFGTGIEPKYLSKLFDRYYLVPGSTQSGTGLGLAICKEFMEAQFGDITVESELGHGSIFTLTLNRLV